MKTILLILFCFLFVGCAGRTMLTRANTSQDEFNRDLWECKSYAQMHSLGMANLVGGNSVIGSGIIMRIDMKDTIRECMQAKGYRVVHK